MRGALPNAVSKWVDAVTYELTISPDFSPEHISGWYIFNTWLQKALGEGIHLELYDGFDAQRRAIAEDRVDLIYANPYDAAMLVRGKGFQSLAQPAGKQDECVIAVSADFAAHDIESLHSGTRIVSTDDPDVHLMGMIMLEPADLSAGNTELIRRDSYVLVAKALLRGQADVGFFLKDAYDDLSAPIRGALRPLVTSQIQVIRHVMLAGPRLSGLAPRLTELLLGMNADPRGAGVLESLGIAGWSPVTREDVEFMIDLMDTLAA